MLTKRGDGLMMDWTQLRLGYRLGMCAILALWVAWDCVWGQYARGKISIGGRSAFPVFRGCFGLGKLKASIGCPTKMRQLKKTHLNYHLHFYSFRG